MILVDTSVWIDHLHEAEPELIELLGADEVACHPMVIEELALGSIRRRDTMLELLASQRILPVLSHAEMLAMIEARRLWGRGLSAVDVHLLGAALLADGTQLWTRDRRLAAACRELGLTLVGHRA